MALIVQKFGGSSLRDVARVKHVARLVQRALEAGHRPVVVASAMGDATDELLDLAASITDNPSSREIDALLATGERVSTALLALALEDLGIRARSLSGRQAGIVTDASHARARIQEVDTRPLRALLAAGVVPVVAGFQGISSAGDVTTFGRGGSDLTAVALAAALQAERCEIFSDVAGIYTADPRIVPHVRKLSRISYDDMLELASLGAQVLQGRAVQYAREHRISIYARSTFTEEPGTIITDETSNARGGDSGMGQMGQMGEPVGVVTGVAYDEQVAKVSLISVPDRPGVAFRVFSALSQHQVNVDMVVQSVQRHGVTDLCFTVARGDLTLVLDILNSVSGEIRAEEVLAEEEVAKVSVVGTGMVNRPGVAATMFHAFSDHKINILMISSSEMKISCLVDKANGHRAVRAVHEAFGLSRA